ncbi:MAG: IPT/TIG domain-containing protein, partial [Candidatus Atribacteria bacterium]|nr:IPT/TIG domain-containing protein [Candidatus Atribacteria bacterium]
MRLYHNKILFVLTCFVMVFFYVSSCSKSPQIASPGSIWGTTSSTTSSSSPTTFPTSSPLPVPSPTLISLTSTPFITAVAPTSAPEGSSVSLTGGNFGSVQIVTQVPPQVPYGEVSKSIVTFNGVVATSIPLWSNTHLVVGVPVGATSGNIVVTVNNGASNGILFTVIPSPKIFTLSPSSGVVGTSVTISGKNFGATQGSGNVSFNGRLATVTSWNDTTIVVTVPGTATTGEVKVFAAANELTSNGVIFEVIPYLASPLVPASGPVGTSVAISGSGFGTTQGSSTVTFNGVAA